MRSATVSQAKNGLSALLDQVKAGESILITDRGVPVARLEPVATSHDPAGRRERLTRAGLVKPGDGAIPTAFYAGPTARMPRGRSQVASVLDERRSGW